MSRLLPLFSLVLALTACQNADAPQPESEAGAETASSEAPRTSEQSRPTSATEPDSCHLTVGWDPWEPYHYAPVGNRVQGLDVDLIGAMADRVGCELEWEQGSWAGLLKLVQSGDLDMLPGATRTAERETFAHFSAPYRQESFQIHVRADEVEDWSGMSLTELLEAGFRLGLTHGYIYGDRVEAVLDDERWQDQLIEVPVGELNFLNLMDFRIDGFLEDPFVAASIDHRRDWGVTFEALPLDVHSGDVHLMFSKTGVDADTVDRFDQALQMLRDSGEHQRILDGYVQTD